MAKQEVPKGLQTKEMVQFTKLYARFAILERMLKEQTMGAMAKGRSLMQMLEEIGGRKRELLGIAPRPSNELPGQEEEMVGGEGARR
ncbi:hypothetical protein LCGC14_1415280 [marine sediment metagenome]|uniref:Uncharacterized protein n=1 Tax=marine sediment metagenome TaxID=412755 RepID=A0A0F9M8I5_9ZZZZ